MSKPWLWLPAKLAHDISPFFLKCYSHFKPLQTLTWSPFKWRHLEFSNRLGLAGGVDKNGDTIKSWWTLGPGFIEVGTVTPRPQKGNPGSTMKRNSKDLALWNHMGFPSKGLDHLMNNLNQLYTPHFTPIFANIGKNRDTPLEKAHEDYVYCIQNLNKRVDAFVINISSPNTQGLRELLKPTNLNRFLKPIVEANKATNKSTIKLANKPTTKAPPTPLLLKLSPDIDEEQLKKVLEISLKFGIDGWVVTNTTTERTPKLKLPRLGGISGRPLSLKSKELLKKTIDFLGVDRTDKLIVSCGGILSPSEVQERIDIGADLVQVYSALVFNGPHFFRQVKKELS